MSHIKLAQPLPGIIGLLVTRPDTAAPLTDLAETLLRKESATFSSADRELIASYVSYLNNCVFCSESHAAAANHYRDSAQWAQGVWGDPQGKAPSARTAALLAIAGKVQSVNFKSVTQADVQKALDLGATENDVHDTVLISAAFCMYNRYVDGLGTLCPPRGDASYVGMGRELAVDGYKRQR